MWLYDEATYDDLCCEPFLYWDAIFWVWADFSLPFLSVILAYLTKECVNSALTTISFFLYKLEANLTKQVLKSGE